MARKPKVEATEFCDPDESTESRVLYDLAKHAFERCHAVIGDSVQFVSTEEALSLAMNVILMLTCSTANFAVTHGMASDKKIILALMAKWIVDHDPDAN